MLRRIILITVDSLRADYSEQIVASTLKVLGRGVNRVAFANGPGTPQSFPAILASSSFLLLNSNLSVPTYMMTLPEILSKHGFVTVGVHSNPYLSRVFGWHRGFKIFYDHFDEVSSPKFSIMKLRLLRKILHMLAKRRSLYVKILPTLRKLYRALITLRASKPPYVDAKDITNIALNILNSYRNDNLFLWIHYMDVHWPYNVPYDELANECEFNTSKQALKFLYKVSPTSEEETPSMDKHVLDKVKCLYKMSITYVSKNIEKILISLKEADLLNDTMIIITGDHGEAFLEHGVFGHPFHTLYNENLLVPIIIWHPHLQLLNSNYNLPTQLREIPPFILKTLNMKVPSSWTKPTLFQKPLIFAESAYVDSVNLVIDKSKYIVAVIDKKYKLILDRIRERVELYDLEKDPEEKNNIVYNNKDVANNLLKIANKYVLALKIHHKIRYKMEGNNAN